MGEAEEHPEGPQDPADDAAVDYGSLFAQLKQNELKAEQLFGGPPLWVVAGVPLVVFVVLFGLMLILTNPMSNSIDGRVCWGKRRQIVILTDLYLSEAPGHTVSDGTPVSAMSAEFAAVIQSMNSDMDTDPQFRGQPRFGRVPTCPAGGTYVIRMRGEPGVVPGDTRTYVRPHVVCSKHGDTK